MHRRTPDKTLISVVLLAISAWFASSCNEQKTTANDLSKNKPNSIRAAGAVTDKPQAEPELYFGEDWATKAAPNASSGGRIISPNQASADPADQSTWSLVLGTFTEGDHITAAQRMIADMPKIAPQIMGARVHTTAKGSMVVYGQYDDREDPRAKQDQERLKQITVNGRKVFNRVPLTRLDMRLSKGQLSPIDLLSARRAHPNVDPLYTLDVAIWLTNDDRKQGEIVTANDVRQRADAYAKKLRAQGHEAYFYHDEANNRSIVTVGLFDRRAINQKSGLFSSDVTMLMKKFPARLVNGEPIETLKARFLPQLGTQPQTPVLVLVPTM
jgi:hypothetical protein